MPLIIDSPGPASCFLDFHKQSSGEVKRSHTILRTACAPHTKEDIKVHCLTSLTSTNFSSSAKTQCDVASFYANSSPRSLGCVPGVLRSSFLPGQYPEQLAPFFKRIPQSPISSKKDVYPDVLAASSQPPVKPVVFHCGSHHGEPSAEALVCQRAGICSGDVIPNAVDSAAVSSQRVNTSYVPNHFSNHTSHPSGPIGPSPSFVYCQSKPHHLAYGSRQLPASRSVAVARCDAMGNADPTHTKEKVLPLIASHDDAQCANTPPVLQQPSNVELPSCVGLPMFKLHNIAVWKGPVLGRGYSGVVHRGLGVVFSESNDCVRMSQPVALKISEHKVAESVRYTTMTTTYSREFDVLKLLFEKNVPVPKPLSFSTHTDTQGRCQTVLSMELIEGQTLRDWINAQTAYVVQHRCTGRTLHPAMSLEHALDRVDVALSLLDALTKLHPFGTFVDLKPRNVMVTSEVSANDYTASGSVLNHGERFTLNSLCHEERPRWRVTLVDMGGVVLRRDLADDCCSCTPSSQAQFTFGSCLLHCNKSKVQTPCTHQPSSPVKTTRPALDSLTNSPQSLSTAPSSVSRNPLSLQTKVGGTASLFASHSLATEECLGSSVQRARLSVAKSFSTTRTVHPDTELNPRSVVEDDGLRIYPTRHRHFLETTCSYVSPEVSAAIVHSDFCKKRLAHHFQPCVKEFLACSRRFAGNGDDSATAARLEYAYAALTPVLASQHVIQYDERVNGRKADNEAQECYVRLGEKSSVFSLGLIFVELFGGLRTGLTGLCQFPVVSEWFASRDVLKQKAKNTLPTPVGTAPQSMDREFRIALEWNLRQLPIVVSTSPSHNEYFDMPTLQQLVASSSSSSSSCSFSHSSDMLPQVSRSPSPLTNVDPAAAAASRRVIWLSSFSDVYKQYCYPKEGLLASARRAPAAHTAAGTELFIAEGSRLWVKYNDVMEKFYVLLSQSSFLSERMSESYVRKEDVLTLQKELVEAILDACLQGSPDRRPTFALLKYALLMLRQLLCVQLIERRNSCEH